VATVRVTECFNNEFSPASQATESKRQQFQECWGLSRILEGKTRHLEEGAPSLCAGTIVCAYDHSRRTQYNEKAAAHVQLRSVGQGWSAGALLEDLNEFLHVSKSTVLNSNLQAPSLAIRHYCTRRMSIDREKHIRSEPSISGWACTVLMMSIIVCAFRCD
jgi:hypothetical protein